jgi:hypothetical protein
MLNVSEMLVGGAQALMLPAQAESTGDYTAGMVGVVAILCVLAAQEAESAACRQSVQNREMRALLGEVPGGPDEDLRLSALEAEGDRLRGVLMARHVSAEDCGDRALEASILALLYRHAEARRLVIPIQPAS